MAHLYNEIEVMLERVFTKLLAVDRRGLKVNNKNEKFSFVDVMILRMLGLKEDVSIFDLIHEMDVDRGIISTSISKLTKSRYVEKRRSPQDGRVFILNLTAEGKLLFKRLHEQENTLVSFIMESSTINEQKAVLKFLSRVNQTMVSKFDIKQSIESDNK